MSVSATGGAPAALDSPADAPPIAPHGDRTRMIEELARRIAGEVADIMARADDTRLSAGRPAGPTEAAYEHKVIIERVDALSRQLLAQGRELDEADEDDLVDRVRSQLSGRGALDRLLMDDDSIENIDANAWDRIWVTRADGSKRRLAPITPDEAALDELIRRAAAGDERAERRFDRGHPSVSFRLRDGSRFTAVQGLSGATAFSVRRHRLPDVDLDDLYQRGTVGHTVAALLAALVRAALNILVVGGTDAGKSTLLRALCNAIDPAERLITVEDTRELELSRHPERHPDVLELECREDNVEGVGAVTMRDLTRLALRLNPDRVIVGEVRGPEILDMFTAMKQGNDGSMGTVHARSSAQALEVIRSYASQTPERLTKEAIDLDVAASLDFIVHIHKPGRRRARQGRRVVSSVREITGYDGTQVTSNEVFSADERGRAVYRGVPLQDATLPRLVDAGFDPALLDLPGGGWTW